MRDYFESATTSSKMSPPRVKMARSYLLNALMTACIVIGLSYINRARVIRPPVTNSPALQVPTVPTFATPERLSIRIPSANGKTHELLSIPPFVDSIVTYVNASDGTPALMAYRARCAEIDWNAQHKDVLFKQRGYNDLQNIDVAIDIGACYGDTVVPIAVKSKHLIAFEPNPFAYEVLEFNARLNPHLHIDHHNYAVGSNDNEFLTFTYGGDMCNGGIQGSWKDASQETSIKVETINMHSFLQHNYGNEIFGRIDYIKIDTEGLDASILRSMRSMIPMLKDTVLIQVEWFDYFDTSRFGGGAGPNTISEGSAELFASIAQLGLIPFIDMELTRHAKGPENMHHSPDLYLSKSKSGKASD